MTAPIDTNAWREMADAEEERWAKATAEPWAVLGTTERGYHVMRALTPTGEPLGRVARIMTTDDYGFANAKAIAAARTSGPALARELRRAADEVERLTKEMEAQEVAVTLALEVADESCEISNKAEERRDRLLALLKEARKCLGYSSISHIRSVQLAIERIDLALEDK